MINHLSVRNFQSLKRVSLPLGKVTVIVGESDIGKSAVVRAIHALTTNKSGHGFISVGESETRVGISAFDSSVNIVWSKGKSASYKLGEEVYDRSGRSVPPEIQDALKITELTLGSETVFPNFHMQFDPPFLVADGASKRSRVLGSSLVRIFSTLRLRKREQERLRQSVF